MTLIITRVVALLAVDDEAAQLARDISKRVGQELQYPGQIKVTVIRETRAVEFAQ